MSSKHGVEAVLGDLVAEGDLTRTDAAKQLAAIEFRSGTINVDAGGNDAISDNYRSNRINGRQRDDFIVTVDQESSMATPDIVRGGFGYDTLIVDEGDTVETGQGRDLVTVDVIGGADLAVENVLLST